jgi:hypothetical protein
MRKRSLFVLFFLAVMSPLAVGAAPPDEIPFRLVRHFAVVAQGDVGTLRGLNFLIDTGAVPSVINQRLAAKLGLTGAPGSFTEMNKESEAQYVTVKGVHFCWTAIADIPMVAVDLTHLEQLLGIRIDVIAGLDIFAGQSFGIDFKRARIFKGLSGLARHEVAAEILSVGAAPYWVIPVEIDGRSLRLLLDTGADEVEVFAPREMASAPERARQASARTFPETDPASAARKTLRSNASRLTLGNLAFQNPSHPELPRPLGALGQLDGLLAPSALRLTRLEFDWDHHCLRWDAN